MLSVTRLPEMSTNSPACSVQTGIKIDKRFARIRKPCFLRNIIARMSLYRFVHDDLSGMTVQTDCSNLGGHWPETCLISEPRLKLILLFVVISA
jgi:hypothetical protein